MYNYEEFGIDQNYLPDNYSEIPFTKDKIKGLSLYSPIVLLPQILVPDEIFRPVIGIIVKNVIPDRYYISNYGRLWDGFANRFISLNYSDPFDDKGYNSGYIKAKLAYYSTPYSIKSIDVLMHRLVLMTFKYFPGCEQFEVNHKDGDHANFRLDNLEFVTGIENVKHAIRNGFVAGRSIPKFNLLKDIVHRICKFIEGGISDSDIFNSTLIPMSAINQIRCGLIETNISSMYNFPIMKTKQKSANISEEMVHTICKYLANNYSPTEIARKCDIPRYVVNDIKFGKNYTYISAQYTIPIKEITSIYDEMIHKVCLLLENNYSNISISRQLDINVNTVANIKSGRVGSHISKKYKIPKPKIYNSKMEDDKVREICKLISQNSYTDLDIAIKTGVSFNMVRDIRSGRSYKHISNEYNFIK